MNTALWWIRRDLRLTDNQALQAAIGQAGCVLPVYILDPVLLNSPNVGEKRLAFLFEGLSNLDADLRQRGSRLIVRQGFPLHELTELLRETSATAIHAESDYSPYARQRDSQIADQLPLQLSGGVCVHPPEFVHKSDGTPYTVYTPFSKAWKALHTPRQNQSQPAPQDLSCGDWQLPASLPLPGEPKLTSDIPFRAGETEAQRRLKDFIDGPIARYGDERNHPGIQGTSMLSPYLRFGMISPSQVVAAAYQVIDSSPDPSARKSAETWLNELIWREFYISVLYHYPHVLKRSFRDDLNQVPWENDPEAFEAWQRGLTGYPIIDAGMRQLMRIGWTHNRVRMLTASFLVKHLLIDWRWGERWFMQHLVDGDPAANNGGWQWSAGTGTDAAPYFRIFNPILQGIKFDSGGDYIRQWVPELGKVPIEYLHKPWEMPPELQRRSACIIGKDYPAPIVEHSWARQRALAVFKQARETYSSAR